MSRNGILRYFQGILLWLQNNNGKTEGRNEANNANSTVDIICGFQQVG